HVAANQIPERVFAKWRDIRARFEDDCASDAVTAAPAEGGAARTPVEQANICPQAALVSQKTWTQEIRPASPLRSPVLRSPTPAQSIEKLVQAALIFER
ncbi:MAG: hypothetical protein AAF709_08990, partial [Pseudomonadota bacterium]